ncbi:glycosyltransferase family 2 protein [bacterium]|nr:glycosyltransferase family 2 protein [bacterium]
MRKKLPFVSVIIPCRNEEKFIRRCLSSVVNQDYPKDRLEVFVVDGMSEDKTKIIALEFARKYPFLKVIENPKKYIPYAMNIGIRSSRGEIIIKMDAHSVYRSDYISKCVKHLQETGADNVGGILRNIPSSNSLIAKSIAFCLAHPFGSGNSYFRVGIKKPQEVDTVAFGCYWRKTLEKVGLYDERMMQSEDVELNQRIKKNGGKIFIFPDIVAYYYPSSSNLIDFIIHNFSDGVWVTYPLKFKIKIFSLRHLIPLFFVVAIILFPPLLALYFFVGLGFSLEIAIREREWGFLLSMPLVFFSRHFFYGLGSIWGGIKIFFYNGGKKTKGN